MKKLLAITILIALLTACDDQSVKQRQFTIDEASIIATVEGEPITLEQVQNEMRYRGGHIPGRFASLESREDLLDEIIHFEVLAQKAKAAGYENDPEIKAALKKMMVRKFRQDYLEKLLHKQRITDHEVQNYYQDNIADFTNPDMFRPAVVSKRFGGNETSQTKAKKRQLLEQARSEALAQKQKYKDFGPLAKKYSDDPRTRYRGGSMNWISLGAKTFQLDNEVLKVLFDMKSVGEISPVIETKKGLFLVKLMNRQGAKARDYNSVKDQIKRSLIAKKQKAWLEEFYSDTRSDMNIVVNTEKLEALPIPGKIAKSDSAPPGFPLN